MEAETTKLYFIININKGFERIGLAPIRIGQGESITLEVYLKEVNLGHSSVGNEEILEHNYKFKREEYLC